MVVVSTGYRRMRRKKIRHGGLEIWNVIFLTPPTTSSLHSNDGTVVVRPLASFIMANNISVNVRPLLSPGVGVDEVESWIQDHSNPFDRASGTRLLIPVLEATCNPIVVLRVLEAFPEAACVGSGYFYPLHLAVLHGERCVLEVVQALAQAAPEILSTRGSSFLTTPFHLSIIRRCTREVITWLFPMYQAEPAAVPLPIQHMDLVEASLPLHTHDEWLRTPLHSLVAYEDVDVPILRRMIELVPDGGTVADCYGRCPLHVATMVSCEAAAVLLLEASPEVLRRSDRQGKLPIHHAWEERQEPVGGRLLQRFLAACPETCVWPDSHQCSILGSPGGLEYVLTEVPGIIREPLSSGDHLSHVALRRGASTACLDILLEQYPDAVKLASGGLLPLHLAIEWLSDMRSDDLTQMKRVASAYPEALAIPFPCGLPLALKAAALNCHHSVLYELIRMKPTACL